MPAQTVCGIINGKDEKKYAFAARHENPYQSGVRLSSNRVKHTVQKQAIATANGKSFAGGNCNFPFFPNTAASAL